MAGEIQTMIPQYGELNRIYGDFIAGKPFSFGMQKFITDFWRQYGDAKAFEAAVLELILDRPKEQYAVILDSLKTEIEKNLLLYETRALPDEGVIDSVCHLHFKSLDRAIAQQQEDTRHLSTLLNEAYNRYDSIGYREHTAGEEEKVKEEYERRKAAYEKAKAELNRLYELQKAVRQEASQYNENRCGDIYRQGSLFMDILKKYVPNSDLGQDGRENRSGLKDTAGEKHEYFGMKLLSLVHEACSGKQFEEIPESSFFACMNLHPDTHRLRIKDGEKVRVCYLISLLGARLTKPDRDRWKSGILKLLDIDESFYASKYREPVSEMPSYKNQRFAQEMDDIFR